MRPHRRRQTFGEELANSISHGLGLLLAIAVTPILIGSAARRGDTVSVVAVTVFAASMIFVYLTSTLYHATPPGRLKRLVRRFDHSAIYLLIAGTYTPFTLGVLRGPWGWSLFGIVWALALLGLFLETRTQPPNVAAPADDRYQLPEHTKPPGREPLAPRRYRKLSMIVYLSMGWLALIAVRPIWEAVPTAGFFWMLGGGIIYTAGILFYAATHVRYAHLAWHLCVLAGSACFCVAVLRYAH